jgi:hypothetical protein
MPEPSPDPFLNQAALEFSYRADHVKEHPACRRAEVEVVT